MKKSTEQKIIALLTEYLERSNRRELREPEVRAGKTGGPAAADHTAIASGPVIASVPVFADDAAIRLQQAKLQEAVDRFAHSVSEWRRQAGIK